MTQEETQGALGLKSNLVGADLLGFRARTSPTRTSTSKVGKPDNTNFQAGVKAVSAKVGKIEQS